MLLFLSQFLRAGGGKGTAWQGSPNPAAGRGRRRRGPHIRGPCQFLLPPLSPGSGWTAVWGSAGRLVPLPAHHTQATGRREMTLTLVSSPILLTRKVLQHVGLVRSERCGVLAE